MIAGIVIVTLGLIVHFLAEAKAAHGLAAGAKIAASAGFVLAAILEGAPHTLIGQALLIALIWAALGDALLIPRDNRQAFLFGMAAFAFAHLGYAFVFHLRGVDAAGLAVGAALAGGAGIAFFLWLLPKLRVRARGMVGPVFGYVLVITIMVAMAVGGMWRELADGWLGLVAAVVFWLSDVTVAMVRFADGRRIWRLVGLPLYYGAQLLFVATLPPRLT